MINKTQLKQLYLALNSLIKDYPQSYIIPVKWISSRSDIEYQQLTKIIIYIEYQHNNKIKIGNIDYEYVYLELFHHLILQELIKLSNFSSFI